MTIFAIHHSLQSIYSSRIPKDKKEFVHKEEISDTATGDLATVIGVCRSAQKCQRVAFESVTEPAAPGLVPYNEDDCTIASH